MFFNQQIRLILISLVFGLTIYTNDAIAENNNQGNNPTQPGQISGQSDRDTAELSNPTSGEETEAPGSNDVDEALGEGTNSGTDVEDDDAGGKRDDSVETCLPPEENLIKMPKDQANILIQKCQLEFEERKSLKEYRNPLWDRTSTFLTLLAGIGAYFLTRIWERSDQEKQRKKEFKLKAADIVLNAKGPYSAEAKAKALKDLFAPEDLDENFADNFQPQKYDAGLNAMSRELNKLIDKEQMNPNFVDEFFKDITNKMGEN